jgi:hypothetical protein
MGFQAAACVQDGKAILLRGASGSGKTTLAYAAVRNGWQTLGESVLWLDTEGDGACWGMPWWFHLPAGLATPAFTHNGRARTEIDLDDAHPGSALASARPAAIVFVERVSGESHIDPVTAAEASALWPRGAAGREADFPEYRRQVQNIVTLPAFRFAFGTDIDAAPRLLTRIVGSYGR